MTTELDELLAELAPEYQDSMKATEFAKSLASQGYEIKAVKQNVFRIDRADYEEFLLKAALFDQLVEALERTTTILKVYVPADGKSVATLATAARIQKALEVK